MKKVTLALAILALVGCKFDENGNKNIIPETTEHSLDVENETTEVQDIAHTEELSAEGTLDEQGNFVYNVGETTTIALPNGQKLEVGENSTEYKLFQMLSEEGGYEIDESDKTQGWVTLDRVYFETGSDGLTANSLKQIDNIVILLNAFPEAKAKLGGYTDNTGSQDINQPLSQGRANAVLNNLMKDGVAEGRLSAEGYGSEHPVCPANDTDLCKAKNRRVDIKITEK